MKGKIVCLMLAASAFATAHVQVAAADGLLFRSGTLSVDTLSEDDAPVKRAFVFRNEGRAAAVVTHVNTGCGCVEADYTRSAVAPGGEGQVTLTFKPKHRPGEVNARATVYVSEGGQVRSYVLSLSGMVTPTSDRWHAYRYRMGDLRLMRKEISVPCSRQTVTERIACANSGTKPLTVRLVPMTVPNGVTVHTEPAAIPPGGEADLVLTIMSEAMQKPARFSLLLDDDSLTPSQRTLTIKVGTSSMNRIETKTERQ